MKRQTPKTPKKIEAQKTISYDHVQQAVTAHCRALSIINDDQTATIGKESGLGFGYYLIVENEIEH